MLLLIILLGTETVQAQLFAASLTGVVRDPSGAVVGGAQVTLTDVDKGFSYQATSNSAGIYVLRGLPPATYTLAIQAVGFKTTKREGLTLEVKQEASIDVTLQLGEVNETVEVPATAPLLNTENATTGQAVDRKFMNDLPLVGRQAYNLALLAPGVTETASPQSGVTAIYGSTGNNFDSNGGRDAGNDILLDGVSSTVNDFEVKYPGYMPSIDAIQEFKVEQNNFSADTGYSGGTVMNVILRSGTNQLHGTAYYFLQNSGFDANNWFNNLAGIPLPLLHWNDFGGSLGGPLQKNKTFFFFNYEGIRSTSLVSFSAGLPSQAERNGDFGELCGEPNGPAPGGSFNAQGMCSDPAGQIWDPYTGVFDPNQGGAARQTFIPYNDMATYQSPGSAGHPLPAALGNIIDPVAKAMVQFWPMPNLSLNTPAYNPYYNWVGTGSNIFNNNQYDIRIDRQFSDRTHLNGRYSHGWGLLQSPLCWPNALDPCSAGPNYPAAHNISLNTTHSFSPSTVLSLSYGFLRTGWIDTGVNSLFPKFDPAAPATASASGVLPNGLGMPPYIDSTGFHASPMIVIGGGYTSPAYGILGQQWFTNAIFWRMTHNFLGSIEHLHGRHDYKLGGEFRISQANTNFPGITNGFFAFDQFGTSQVPGSGGGDGMATFLTGTSTDGNGQYFLPMASAMTSRQVGGYALDNWQATSKLKLNIGLRYDVEVPTTERFNRLNYFDPNIPSPLQVPGLPNLKGGDVFVTPSHRTQVPVYWGEWQPRIGLAYRLLPNTVMRAGYGIFYNVYEFAAGSVGFQPGEDGFQTSTNWLTTYQNNLATPGGALSDPFPNGFVPVTGSTLGALTNVGRSPSGPIRSWNTSPQTQTWSLGFEQLLPGDIVVDANYVGTKGTHLLFGGFNSLDFLGPWVENLSPTQRGNLAALVPNPFYGVVTDLTSSLSAPTIPAWQLQIPFPQFNGMNLDEPPWANSIYHALQLRVEKKFSHGLQFLASYTFSKSIDDSSVVGNNWTYIAGPTHLRDPNRLSLERGVSQFDIPQVLQISYVYQLPIGRGKALGGDLSGWLNSILGGWQTNGIWRFDNGRPLQISLAGGVPIPSYGQPQPDLTAPLKKNHCSNSGCLVNQYFANPQVAVAPADYTLGNAPATLPYLRAPGTRNASLSIFKEFEIPRINEGAHLELRLETFNALNHPQFCAPSTVVNAGNFGVITCQVNLPRQLQLGAKLYF